MSVYYKDYPREMLPYLGLTVFEAIKKTDSLPIFDGYLPHVESIIDDKHLKIQTYQSRYHSETGQRFFRFYMVFDVMNNIKDDCKNGYCIITKNDSIGAITIPYPSKTSYEVNWHMELSTKLEKYLENSQEYSLSERYKYSDYLADRVQVDNHVHIISWRDQVDSAPTDIRKALSDAFLVTHVENVEVTKMEKFENEDYKDTSFYGKVLPCTKYEKQTVPGFLNKLQIPEYVVL